jgi:hypothetical protein
MQGYKVNIDSTVIESQTASEPYGDWYCEKIHSMSNIALRVNEYPDITSNLDIQAGMTAIVVWAIWSTGDSFGTSKCDSAEAMGIFVDPEAATQFASVLEKFSGGDGAGHNCLEITTIDGQHHKVYVPWVGYFEYFETIEVSSVIIV